MKIYCLWGEELKQVDVFGAGGVGMYFKPCQECVEEKVGEAKDKMRSEIETEIEILYNEIEDNLRYTLNRVLFI